MPFRNSMQSQFRRCCQVLTVTLYEHLILTQQMDSEYSTPEKNQLEIICRDSADISAKLNVRKLNPA